ncbi:hypothetical protein SLEP1_g42856 [Rubroshorea leprosula]|uniref:NB-ARC domain-containing protein n=1 Tax=Rubroshorea leprosula TaxID=152421 RepID=A0AAV5LBQ8_9ROSI|nr:hypothetical protein SLEP1_g42856 [Rubroshorea leprosula]
METTKPIYDIVKDVVPTVWACVKYQLCLGDYVSKFNEKKASLLARQEVIKARIQTEAKNYPGKIESMEVKDWLDRGDKIIQGVEDKVKRVGCFSHICVAKYLDEKTREVKEIFDEGEKYTKVDAILVVDDHSRKGVAIPIPELKGRDATKTKILKYLMEDKITRIGVCGLGGIGKTTIIKHVHNELLNTETKFKKVVLVTVTKQFDIIKLQKDIASQLKVSLPNGNATMCAAVLSEMLEKNCYLLILDDVWEYISLEDVGIPDLVGSNNCKLVLTTRFQDVARHMNCEIVNLEPLPKKEALQLFLNKVGSAVLTASGGIINTLEPTLRQFLVLDELENLKSLFEEEALAPSALSFPLKTISIVDCPKIKKLFSPRLLVWHLQNLQSILVYDCEELEEIIASEGSKEEDGKLPLPNLKMLDLGNMPKLKSICGRTRVLVCDSLEALEIANCPMLKRVPLSPPPSLKEIKVSSKESWESLEWEHPNAKDILLPLVEFDRWD